MRTHSRRAGLWQPKEHILSRNDTTTDPICLQYCGFITIWSILPYQSLMPHVERKFNHGRGLFSALRPKTEPFIIYPGRRDLMFASHEWRWISLSNIYRWMPGHKWWVMWFNKTMVTAGGTLFAIIAIRRSVSQTCLGQTTYSFLSELLCSTFLYKSSISLYAGGTRAISRDQKDPEHLAWPCHVFSDRFG